MRTTLLALLVAVVIASGCVGGGGNQKTKQQAKESATVEYTDSGFQPETVVIEKGGNVIWVDNSSNQMWVASDRHLVHSQYDGTSVAQHCTSGESNTFDQCSSGARYTFTFNKSGSWSYHNHEFSDHGGRVVVR